MTRSWQRRPAIADLAAQESIKIAYYAKIAYFWVGRTCSGAGGPRRSEACLIKTFTFSTAIGRKRGGRPRFGRGPTKRIGQFVRMRHDHRFPNRFRLQRAAAQAGAGLCAVAVVALMSLFSAPVSAWFGAQTAPSGAAAPAGQDAGANWLPPGPARIVDGDTIEVAGRRVRLEGIDAPEMAQTCQGGVGDPARDWDAGRAARRQLQKLIADSAVSCRDQGRDRYGRTLATCFVDGRDINAAMVSTGYAWAFVKYSSAYVGEEAAARRARLGVWQGGCQTAWDYRANRWATGQTQAPEGCPIKGNVSRSGRVYHTPWSPWYARTTVDPARGERWFCSEAEAIAAGWRPAAAG